MTTNITLLGALPLILFILVILALLCSPFILARIGIRAMRKRGVERFKPLLFIAAGVFFVIILMDVAPLVTFLGYGLHYGLTQRRSLDQAIKNDLPEIAEACLALRHYATNHEDFVSINCGDARLPDVINRTHCRDVQIMTKRIQIEMHGGMDHFGILLEQDQSVPNVWQVLRYWEGGDELLMTLTNKQKEVLSQRDD